MRLRLPCRLGGLTTALVLCFTDLGTALFALADESSLAAEIAKLARFLDFLRETSQQRIKTFIIALVDSHVPAHPLSHLAIPACASV